MSNRPNSATFHPQTHVENKLAARFSWWSPTVPSCVLAALFTVPLTSPRGLFLPDSSDNKKQVRSLSTGKPLGKKSRAQVVFSLFSPFLLVRRCFGCCRYFFERATKTISCEIVHNSGQKQQNNVLDGRKLLTQRVELVLPLRSAHASLEE